MAERSTTTGMSGTSLLACGSAPMLVNRREAGRLLGVSPGTIDNLRLRGELPSVKIGARRLFDVADLRRYVDEQKAVGK